MYKQVSIFITLLCLSITVNAQHLAQNQYVKDQVIVTFDLKQKIDGLDFEVNYIYQPIESDLTVYISKKLFDGEHCPPEGYTTKLTQDIAVYRDNKLIWKDSGYFDSLRFSSDGKTFKVFRHFHNKSQKIIINDLVTIHENRFAHYEEGYVPDDQESRPCFLNYEGFDEHLISNSGTHSLSFFIHDGLETPFSICTIKKQESGLVCQKVNPDWTNPNAFFKAQIVSENEIYVLYEHMLTRQSPNKTLWNTTFSDKFHEKFNNFFVYKNLLILNGINDIAVFDKNNGQILWQRSRQGEEKVLQTFDSVFAKNNQLIFQLEGTTIHGAQNLSQFIE